MLNKIAEEEELKRNPPKPSQDNQADKHKQKTSALEGNLALKFLMNPKELSQIVNFKDKKRQSIVPQKDDPKVSPVDEQRPSIDIGSVAPLQKSKKYKYPIKSINEFIQKMLKKELTAILNKTLSQDDYEWAGVKVCFNTFYEKIKEKLIEDPILS